MSLKYLKGLPGSLALLFLAWPALCVPVTVQVVKSGSLGAYETANAGFQRTLRENLKEVQFLEYTMTSEPAENQRLLGQIEKHPNLILTIGTEATRLVSGRIKDRPVVFCMVLEPARVGLVKSMESSGNNLSGASLDVPVRTQFERFKALVPGLKNLGVLYTSETETRVRNAEAVARKAGINLISVRISSEKEIPQSLEWLKGQTEGLWAVPDGMVFSPASTEQVLLFTLRQGIPLMGLSSAYVKAGALFSLDCDYGDIGRQAGETALLVLSGNPPSEIPVTRPRIVNLTLNEKTAKRIGLKIPAQTLKSAEVVLK